MSQGNDERIVGPKSAFASILQQCEASARRVSDACLLKWRHGDGGDSKGIKEKKEEKKKKKKKRHVSQ